MKTPILSGPAAKRGRALLLVVLAMVAGLVISVAPASAQTQPAAEEPLRPPQPGKPDDPPLVWNYLTMAAVLGLVGFAALIPSKRGHQD